MALNKLQADINQATDDLKNAKDETQKKIFQSRINSLNYKLKIAALIAEHQEVCELFGPSVTPAINGLEKGFRKIMKQVIPS